MYWYWTISIISCTWSYNIQNEINEFGFEEIRSRKTKYKFKENIVWFSPRWPHSNMHICVGKKRHEYRCNSLQVWTLKDYSNSIFLKALKIWPQIIEKDLKKFHSRFWSIYAGPKNVTRVWICMYVYVCIYWTHIVSNFQSSLVHTSQVIPFVMII